MVRTIETDREIHIGDVVRGFVVLGFKPDAVWGKYLKDGGVSDWYVHLPYEVLGLEKLNDV